MAPITPAGVTPLLFRTILFIEVQFLWRDVPLFSNLLKLLSVLPVLGIRQLLSAEPCETNLDVDAMPVGAIAS